MKLNAEDAGRHFAQHPLPFLTLIAGDELVLNLESLDAARARARADGFTERRRFDTGAGFKWSDVLTESQSLSLFAPKRLIEVHGEDKKLDKKSADVFAALAAAPDEHLRILLHLPALEKPLEQAWYKSAFQQDNLAVVSHALNPQTFVRQVDARLHAAHIDLTANAREHLLEYCQGNLLAAKQAIERLTVRAQGTVHEKELVEMLSDAALFSVFAFADHLWRGEWLQAWRIAGKLQVEDSQQIILLTWTLARDASLLLQLHDTTQSGDQVFTAFRIYGNRKRAYGEAQRRFSPAALRTLLKLAARLDRLAKGVEKGDPWLVLRQFLLLKAQRT